MKNLLMQYTNIVSVVQIDSSVKKNHTFNIFAQNIDCGPCLGGSNEYPQSMFWIKNNKTCILLYIPILLYKSGV